MSELEELPSWAGRSVSNTPSGDAAQDSAEGVAAEAAVTASHTPALADQPAAAAPVQPQYVERRRRPVMMFLLGFLGLLALVGVGVLGYLLAQSQNSSSTETAGETTEDAGQLGSEASDATTDAEGGTDGDNGTATAGTDTDAGAEEDEGSSAELTVETDEDADAAGEESEDGDTTTDTEGAADGEDGTAADNDRIAVFRGGKVYLSGSVPSEEVGQFIEQKAAAVVGPDNVVNEYVIDPSVVIEPGSSAPLYVEDVVLFEFNSIEVAQAFLPILDLGTLLLRQNPQASVTVVTRTDAIGSEEVNLDVSTKRAQAVINYWLGKGVNPDQINADPRGEEGASESDDEQTAALNRRAEFIITGLLD